MQRWAEISTATKNQSHQAILFASSAPGSARNPHVRRVRSGFSALAVSRLAATITPDETGFLFFKTRIQKKPPLGGFQALFSVSLLTR